MNTRHWGLILGGSALILLIPYTAMQFTAEVNWSWLDFAVAAVLLIGTGQAISIVLTKVTRPAYRILLTVSVLLLLLIIWAELAVGLFGSPLAGS
ncbi:MAG: hypothetical protein L6Q77_01800 [Bacteroidetes bacterium]|nr:hypothetical protein [Bacteroidota bacterium]